MSERLSMHGFSLARMRRLFRSRDASVASRIRDRLASEDPHLSREQLQAVFEIVERAVMTGVPFAGLGIESHEHWLAADALAEYEQEPLVTLASVYPASALRDGLWKGFGKYARPEIGGFLRALVEGLPLFGQGSPSVWETDGLVYAAIGLEKLRSFGPGLDDLREQVTYRVGRKKDPSEEDRAAVGFVADLCGWVDEIREAGMDLWFTTS